MAGVAPRAFVARHLHRVTRPEEAMAYLRGTDDPAVGVAVEDSTVPPGLPDAMAGTVRIAAYRPQEVELEARMETPGLVVLTDTLYPGWTASVDDQPAPIVRANYFARGVYVDAGEHRIVFRYAPLSHRLGMLLSVLTGAGMLAGVVIAARRRPHTAPSPRTSAGRGRG